MAALRLLGIVILVVVARPALVEAARNPNLRLYVYSLECTEEIINDGSTQNHQLTPEECEAILHPPPTPPPVPSPDDPTLSPLPPQLLVPTTQTPTRFPSVRLPPVQETHGLEPIHAHDVISGSGMKAWPLAVTLIITTAFGGAIILGAEMSGIGRLIRNLWRRFKRRRKV